MAGDDCATPHSLAPELKACILHSSEPSQNSSQLLLSPSFPSKLCVHPACDRVFLFRHMTEFQVSKFYGLLWCGPALFLLGEGGGSPHASAFKTPSLKGPGQVLVHSCPPKGTAQVCSTASVLCTAQRFKPFVVHSIKLLRGFLPSVHTSDPATEHCSMTPSWPFVFGKAKYTLPNVLWEGE